MPGTSPGSSSSWSLHLFFPVLLAASAALPPATAARAQQGAARPGRPAVHVIATGGTIASTPGGILSGRALAEAVPALDSVARIDVEEFSRIGSSQMTPDHWLRLARRIDRLFEERAELSGIVVTHGTDTMEETAFFLHLTVRAARPVVVTGAMRPARAPGADGPANLLNAVRVAADGKARGRGVLVLLNDELHQGARVTKTHTTRVDAFRSPGSGPVGVTDPDRVIFFGRPASPPLRGAFDVSGVSELPPVGIAYSYGGADGTALRALRRAGARGLVVAAVGRGNLPAAQREAATDLARDAVPVAVSSRTNGGRVPVDGVRRGDDSPAAAPFGAASLNPQKAWVLLMLGLSDAALRRASTPGLPEAGPTKDESAAAFLAELFRRF